MAGEFDPYLDRKPSIGFGKGGAYVRGFRSRPGAPQHDPNKNRPMSRDSMTEQSAWDQAFRNTASNDFGAGGTNPEYVSSFPNPADEQDEIPTMAQLANGGTLSHQEMWSSQPSKPRPSRGWELPDPLQNQSILNRYGPKRTSSRFGWGNAFSDLTPNGLSA